jgi:hypothetical protein
VIESSITSSLEDKFSDVDEDITVRKSSIKGLNCSSSDSSQDDDEDEEFKMPAKGAGSRQLNYQGFH